MRRKVFYRQGYKIVINDKFYEVSDGKRLLHYNYLKHKPTLEEVWNKTIRIEQEELNAKQRARAI